jgi:hypothetical protein
VPLVHRDYNLASLAFRFKAGGDGTMPSSVASHSHRSTTKASHKPFKSRKATKGTLKEIQKGREFLENLEITIADHCRQGTGP